MKTNKNSHGFALITVVIALVVISVMAVFFTNFISTESALSVDKFKGAQAYYIAEGGLEYVLKRKPFPNYAVQNIPLGAGRFNVYTSGLTGGNTVTVRSEGIFQDAKRTLKTDIVTSVALAGINFDAASSLSGSTNSLQWSHTVGTGTNRILIVGVSIRYTGTQTVTGVTYGSNNLTYVNAWNYPNSLRVEIWRLLLPPIGSANVTVSLSASTRVVGGAVSFFGVDQTNPIEANTSNNGNNTTPAITITTLTNNAWVFDVLASRENVTLTYNTIGGTQRYNLGTGAGANGVQAGGSTFGPKTPPGNVTMNWTLSSTQNWLIGAVSIKPAASGTPTGFSVLNKQEVSQ